MGAGRRCSRGHMGCARRLSERRRLRGDSHQKGRENGYCDFGSCRIGIRPDVEPLQAVKILVMS